MRKLGSFLVILVAIFTVSPVGASDPTITGKIFGHEVCAQFICTFAAFAGDYQGKIDGKGGAKGTFLVQVNHDPLPTRVGGQAEITEGSWVINTNRGTFLGTLTGTLTYLGNEIFALNATLTVTLGGSGDVQFAGFLNHQGLPFELPTISGEMSQ